MKTLRKLISVFLLAALVISGATTPAQAQDASLLGRDVPVSPALLQFTVNEHILGFAADRAYLAGLDHALVVEFVGATSVALPQSQSGGEVTAGAAPPLGTVTYPDLWPGITLTYAPDPVGLAKATYTLAPGADPTDIRLHYNLEARLESDGSLKFTLPNGQGWLSESAPLAWQDDGSQRLPVAVRFVLAEDGSVGFILGDYDPRLPLTIDPTYEWHTFYGTAGNERCRAIAVDASGNIYVAGYSNSYWYGSGGALPLHPPSGDSDYLVIKLSSSGDYLWHTFYGSTSPDQGYALSLDASGGVYLTGRSFITWNGDDDTPPLHAHSAVGSYDFTVLKLNTSGAYQWHTFYGSNSDDSAYGIALDGSGNVYVTGESAASWNGDDGAAPLHGSSGGTELTVLKLSSNGAYQWHTFYGSNIADNGWGIAVDSSSVYVAGSSGASWNSGSGTLPLHAHSGVGNTDFAMIKLNASGAYLWHTFYGSTNGDQAYALALDGSNLYITGTSFASWDGDGGAPPLHSFGSAAPVIALLKLNTSGAYQWHTFYGENSYTLGLTVDTSGAVYAAGYSGATWLGDGSTSPLHTYNAAFDAFVLKVDSSGAYQWHTFHGSAVNEYHMAAAVNGGQVILTGLDNVPWDGDSGETALRPYGGREDLHVLVLSDAGIYQWHTFYAVGGGYEVNAMVVDEEGGVYVAGQMDGMLPLPGDVWPLHSTSGNLDFLLIKLDQSGAFQWYTLYGSTGTDYTYGLAVDSSSVYLIGCSPGTWNGDGDAPPLHAHSGLGSDLLVLKLSSGGAYQWHTFYGGAGDDYGRAMAVSGSSLYVGGYSVASWDGDDGAAPMNPHSGSNELVVLKLTSGGAYQWHTFYGSTHQDYGYGLAVDNSGIYLTGYSSDTWTGVGGIPPIHAHSGSAEIVILKLNLNGAYLWHTFYGSGNTDVAYALALDGSGGVHVAGYSSGTWDGDGSTPPIHAYSGGDDFTVLKVNTSGAYQWHTFYGSASTEYGYSMAADGSGGIYVSGVSWLSWNGDGETPPLHAHSGSQDLAVFKLDGDGVYQWHTFYGAPASYEVTRALGLDGNGGIYAAGMSGSSWNGDNDTPPLQPLWRAAAITILKLLDGYSLNVTPTGSGSGVITSSPPGIDCGESCSNTFFPGTLVALSASADFGSTFQGWEGAGCGGTGECQVLMTDTFTVTASFSNDAPVAYADSYTLTEDIPLFQPAPGLLANDLDTDPLSATLDTPPALGDLILDASGAFTYTAPLNFNGVLTFTYHAFDGFSASNTALVTLTVEAVNDAPQAENAAFATPEETAYPGLVTASDPEGDVLTFSVDILPLHGSLQLQDNGVFTYTPALDYNGADSFTFAASDGSLADLGLVNITVTPINDAPTAIAGGDQASMEGDRVEFSGSYDDPDSRMLALSDPVLTAMPSSAAGTLVSWHFGDGTMFTGALTPTHVYIEDGIYTVTLTITDEMGAVGMDWLVVTVSNVAPSLEALLDLSVTPGQIFTVTATYSDPGLLDALTATVAWGNGFTDTLPLDASQHSFDFAYSYEATGVYTVTVSLEDGDGGLAVQVFVVTVEPAAPPSMRIWMPTIRRN